MFTRKDFKQLFYIDREIEAYREEMKHLESKGAKSTQVLSDMPRGSGISRKVEDAALDAVEVDEVIAYAIKKREREKAKIMRLIDEVEESEMRLILFCRYVQCMSWRDVAKAVNSTVGAVKNKEYRFFEKNESVTSKA